MKPWDLERLPLNDVARRLAWIKSWIEAKSGGIDDE